MSSLEHFLWLRAWARGGRKGEAMLGGVVGGAQNVSAMARVLSVIASRIYTFVSVYGAADSVTSDLSSCSGG